MRQNSPNTPHTLLSNKKGTHFDPLSTGPFIATGQPKDCRWTSRPDGQNFSRPALRSANLRKSAEHPLSIWMSTMKTLEK